jgi:hypothetical protein
MSEEQISAIVHGLGGLLGLLCHADPSEKAEIYSRLGLQLTYRPGAQTLIAEVTASAIDGVNNVCPEGDPNTRMTCMRRMNAHADTLAEAYTVDRQKLIPLYGNGCRRSSRLQGAQPTP